MSLDTKNVGALTPEMKRARIKTLREFHQATLDKLGLSDAVFLPKVRYKPAGKSELYISFFPSELKDKQDIYMEFITREFEPETEERTLFKWRWNPHYNEEYEQTEVTGAAKDPRYLVPISELIPITDVPATEATQTKLAFELPDPETDLPMDQFTIRDYAAVHLRKPVSHKSWLNDIITSK